MPQTQDPRSSARSLRDRGSLFLTLQPPAGPQVNIRMTSSRLVVGRGSECDLQLRDPQCVLSRRHIQLERRPEGLRVTDLSRNGCHIDGVPLRKTSLFLRAGQRIRLGGFSLGLSDTDKTEEPRTTLSGSGRHALHMGLIGSSVALQKLRSEIVRSASFQVPVLIKGETGTGKELVARALHQASSRSRGPFVAVNCGAIPEGTAASELFGHQKGAFTGASTSRLGAFRRAHGGTLFLDEIGELPSTLQATLLRALETREVLPLGAEETVPVSFRLVVATHRDLEDHVRRGTFREDLYYRVNVIEMSLPPLRERGRDVVELARHFAAESSGGRADCLTDEALAALSSCMWPGNVRQLRNVVVRALVASRRDSVGVEDLDLRGAKTGSSRRPREREARSDRTPSLASSSEMYEGVFGPTYREEGHSIDPQALLIPPVRLSPREGLYEIAEALRRSGGNRSLAAQALGISRSTLYARLTRYKTACEAAVSSDGEP